MNEINNISLNRDRGLEVLLYRGTTNKVDKPYLYKFSLARIFSIFSKEISIKFEFVIRNK